jgi:vancomycin permeability regulator SanA
MTITREFTFENAVYVKDFYKLDTQTLNMMSPRPTDEQIDKICREILSKSPLIIYFEDFKDHIPDFIHTKPENKYYNRNWVKTLEGLFYHVRLPI